MLQDVNDSRSTSRVAQLGSGGAVKVSGKGKKLGSSDQSQTRQRGIGSNVRGLDDVKPACGPSGVGGGG